MKNKVFYFLTFIGIFFTSCKKYLNQVPANIATLNDAFKAPGTAYNFMASCYNYVPNIQDPLFGSMDVGSSDEFVIPWGRYNCAILVQAKFSASNPLFDLWGSGGLFDGIRQCYTFLDNIDKTPNLPAVEKNRMKGEVTFLIGYFHFALLRAYGPIVIIDKQIPIFGTSAKDNPKRQPYDSCVNFIANILDKAATMLPPSIISSKEYGRATSVIAKALKARMFLYAASPLFNGNSEYYSNFKNKDGQPLMNLTYDASKWQRAADACLDAINSANAAGVQLYLQAPVTDPDPAIQALFNYRYATVDPWNKELIWGYSNGGESYLGWQRSAMPNADNSGTVYNGISPTLAIIETYYTKNGLPINRDNTFDYANRYQISGNTINLNQNREPRFYASIAADQGIYYCNATNVPMNFLYGQAEGWSSGQSNYSPSGYLIQKMVHPNSILTSSNSNGAISYPWPIFRLSELYLSYAEALNEAKGPVAMSTILQYVDPIRSRAGIPGVMASWAKIGVSAFSQNDLRQIIQTERMIELAFEGHRCWDLRRWKLGAKYLNVPVSGMNIKGATPADFYQATPIENRSFTTPTSYLMPISVYDISTNVNLVQNPGW